MTNTSNDPDKQEPSLEEMQKLIEPDRWWTCESCWNKRHDVMWRTLDNGGRVCICDDCFKRLNTGEKD